MANTYSQIYIQVVFAVEARQYLIRPEFHETVQRYITGIPVTPDGVWNELWEVGFYKQATPTGFQDRNLKPHSGHQGMWAK